MFNPETACLQALVLDFCLHPEKLADEFQGADRTIQQSFTRLCVEWLKVCADEGYLYDERNEASHEVAKLLMEGHEDLPDLPLI